MKCELNVIKLFLLANWKGNLLCGVVSGIIGIIFLHFCPLFILDYIRYVGLGLLAVVLAFWYGMAHEICKRRELIRELEKSGV